MKKQTTKKNYIIPKSIRFSSARTLVSALFFGLIGTILTLNIFAATANTSFSGKLSGKKPSVTHNLSTSASGTLTAKATLTRLKSATLELLNSSGTVLSTSTSAAPQLSVPIGSGNYSLRISSAGNGNYKIDVSYPIADPDPPADTTPPSAPSGLTAAAVSTNQINLTWQSATDNVGVAGYYIYRNNVMVSSTVATSYSDVSLSPATNYTYTVKAKDAAGNVSPASNSATASTFTPPDTTAPTLNIGSPANNETISGTKSITGTASDNTSLSKVELQIDNNGYVPTTGTTNWAYSLNTNLYSNGTHTITARATDAAGNQNTASLVVIINNSTSTSSPPETQGSWVSPEGVTIEVNSTNINKKTGQLWTIADVYSLLMPEVEQAGDFATIAPTLKVRLQDNYASQTTSAATGTDGVYSSYSATIYLRATTSSSFYSAPESIMAHEYGHVWTNYHLYLSQNGNWSPYLNTRWVTADGSTKLSQDSRLDSTYNWSKNEMIADDYRLLFGTQTSRQQSNYINSQVIDPRQQPNLRDWFLANYAN